MERMTTNNQPNSPEPESKTPRTDKVVSKPCPCGRPNCNIATVEDVALFARTLELELGEAKRAFLVTCDGFNYELDQLRQQLSAVTKERDEARDQCNKLSALLSEEKSATHKRCPRCGDRHNSHIGCASDWTGTDLHGR